MRKRVVRKRVVRKRVVRVNTDIERANVSAARTEFMSEMRRARRRWARYFNVDESSWHLNASSGYGYALRGQRAVVRRPAVRGIGDTMLEEGEAEDDRLEAWQCGDNHGTGRSATSTACGGAPN